MRIAAASACAAIAAAALLPLGAAAEDDEVLAIVNGEPIPNAYFERIMAGSQLPRDQAMQNLIVQVIVAQEARKQGMGDEPKVQTLLSLAAIEALSGAYVERFFDETSIPDEEIREEYDSFVESQKASKEYLARHILLEEEDDAKDLIDEVGNDVELFAAAAKDKSIDTVSGNNGGVLDWAPAEAYVPEFSEALAALEPGEVTEKPVQTQFGWHVVLLEEVRAAAVPELSDLEGQISENLLRLKFAEHLEELKSTAEIEELGG